MKKHVIITSSDQKYGNFLIEHWLKSLKENVDLKEIDIYVIDYGLSVAQRYFLKCHGVNLYNGVKDGHITVIRFRDIRNILLKNNYNQVLICDGGDIIFQSNISDLFLKNTDQYRAVCEDGKAVFNPFLTDEFFSKENKKILSNCLLENKTINAGFVLGPRQKMIYLCKKVGEIVENKTKFGPDQLVVNLVLYNQGFYELNNQYNFVIPTAQQEIIIKKGAFYLKDGKKIPVVHNAGNISLLRSIRNFGYGSKFNILKKKVYFNLKRFYKSNNSIYQSQKKLESFINNLIMIATKKYNQLRYNLTRD